MKNDSSPPENRLGLWRILSFPFISFFLVAAVYIFSIGVINNLPRAAMGERVLISLPVCLGLPVVFQLILTLGIARFLMKIPRSKKYFIIWMFLFMTFLFVFGFVAVAEKAWRRGI